MLYGLKLGLQKCFERHRPYEMFEELRLVFQAHARVERLLIDSLACGRWISGGAPQQQRLAADRFPGCLRLQQTWRSRVAEPGQEVASRQWSSSNKERHLLVQRQV